MKKHLSVLTILLCAVLSLSSCASDSISKYSRIDMDDVDYMMYYISIDEERRLSADEMEKMLKLYNAAEKVKDTDAGDTTPNFSVRIYFKNGESIHVSDFPCYGHTLQVQHGEYENRFFINSEELADFMEGLYQPES